MYSVRIVLSLLVLCVAQLCTADYIRRAPVEGRQAKDGHWVDIWGSMPQLTEPANLPPAPFNGSNGVFVGATLRQTLRMTLSANQIRIRVSNVFGGTDLPVTAITVALPTNNTAGISGIQSGTVKTLTFSGSPSIIIPNGALAVTDPVDFPVKSQGIVTVSIYLADGQRGFAITSHPGSRTTSWMTNGNQVSAASFSGSGTASTAHWYFLSAVEGWLAKDARAVALVGDSITDGRGSTTDQNNRWPDLLLNRLQKSRATSNLALINQAAGGNRILGDGLGPNAQGRIDRDVLAHSGTRYAIVFIGVNDIGGSATNQPAQDALYARLVIAYKQMATRIRALGIPVFGATITPFGAPNQSLQAYSHPLREGTRLKINEWIRTGGAFDAVLDFDKILRDPKNATMLNPTYDSGDYLHPNVKGYQALADGFPVEVFEDFKNGVSGFT